MPVKRYFSGMFCRRDSGSCKGGMGIGKERKLSNGWRSLDCFWEECLSYKREKMNQVVATTSENEDEESFIDFLECYLSGNEVTGATPSEKVMRDNVIGLILEAEGTTSIILSWFFWLLSKNNPLIEAKLREEITENFSISANEIHPGRFVQVGLSSCGFM
ncbi:hypothetical protein Patl1_27768 [Pistacia atlantica]|uniref:Uncharacterized protein n=1 Tax=Pistacia atlantica TaxID=434234 RepID=A0ACC1BFL7_9ROSI|nr:hypothetical protein Patl1_27768 [Pistacia atlantica]